MPKTLLDSAVRRLNVRAAGIEYERRYGQHYTVPRRFREYLSRLGDELLNAERHLEHAECVFRQCSDSDFVEGE